MAEDTEAALEGEPADLVVYIDSLGVSILDRFSARLTASWSLSSET